MCKDIILVAAGLVIAAATFRGGRLVRDEPQPSLAVIAEPIVEMQVEHKLEVVLAGRAGRRVDPGAV